jgi:hypothetical protein
LIRLLGVKSRVRENGNLQENARGISRRGCRFCQSLILVVLFGAFAGPVHASIRAWGCLLYASNAGKGLDLPPWLAGYDAPLRRSLGYASYHVIAQGQIVVGAHTENLLVSAGDIQVLLTSLSHAPDGRFLLELLFVEGTQQVMETQAKVGQGSPLFIRGPDWRDGQIIIVVMVAA